MRALADKIETGRVTLRQGNEELVLVLPGQMVMEVKAEDEEKGSKGTQHSLEVELKWWTGLRSPGGGTAGVKRPPGRSCRIAAIFA
ncbi:amphi-Trp domain-containing protein [Rhabdonatronobacter sediminivivens]|uniref:amphi-Trp domain-containing protein n=1 Tax=Rhabdonatronobacter sediminivivens TaxID=2743469 RepID=UPI0022856BAC|nr:amphi-Trp domain-containing protein [Rhabdonatronobacter sediminivivens]